jgi:hypothetical protein
MDITKEVNMTGLDKLKIFMKSYLMDAIDKYNITKTFEDNYEMDSANIVLDLPEFSLILNRDRGQTFIYFQSKFPEGKKLKNISIDIMKILCMSKNDYEKIEDNDVDRFFEGNPKKRQEHYDLEESLIGDFISNNFEKIYKLFKISEIKNTIIKIKNLRKKENIKYVW